MCTRIIPLLLGVLLSLSTCWGQLSRGYISGTLQDASGAVIDGATVKITNKATNIDRTSSTNSSGLYRFVAVEPGAYTVEFAKTGFETKRIANIEVAIAQEVTLNESLAVGTTTVTLDVTDATAGVELSKSTATIERTLSQQSVVNLPITSGTRDITQLALLAPTATRAPGSTGISANGQRARNNNFLLDGVDNNDPSVTIANARVVPESVQEFQVQTSAYSAEYGRNTGAQIIANTRSGSNGVHGDAYDYFQSNIFTPVSLSNKRNNIFSTPRFTQNQPGGDVGGPIIKNKTFFFALIETTRLRQAPTATNATAATIPTQAGFQLLSTIPLGPGQTADSRAAVLNSLNFLNNIYPKVTGYSNLRTSTVNGVSIPIGTVTLPIANPFDFWNGVARVDHQISSSDTISYRALLDHRTQPDVVSNLQFGSLFSGAQEIFRQNHMLSETHTFKPNLLNEFRFAFIRGYLAFPENDPTTPTTGIGGFFTIGGLNNFPQGRIQNTFQYQDIATWIVGRHSLKFGVDLRRQQLANNAAFDSKGTYTFNTFTQFLNNNAFSLVQSLNTASFAARQWQQAYFVQDDFKATKDLTFNFGLRYEYSDAPFGFFGATDPTVRATLVPGPVQADGNNVGPRFGVAYSPSHPSGILGKVLGDGRTVFRGGYGIGYDVLFYNILTVNGSNYPRVINTEIDTPATQNLYPKVAAGQAVTTFNPLATFVNSPTNLQSPTAHFYSAAIQRQLASDWVLEIGYTGTRSYHAINQDQANPGTLTQAQADAVIAAKSSSVIPSLQLRRVNPTFGSRVLIASNATGNYNAGYLKIDKKLSHGLLFGANYTYSSNFSNNDESLGVGAITNSSPQIPQNFKDFKSEYGRSAFDRPNRFAGYFLYNIPWFKGTLNNAVMSRVFNGWSINGLIDFQSGQPFTVRTGVDTYGENSTAARPDYNPAGVITLDPVTHNFRTFTTPLNGTGIFLTPVGADGLPLANSQVRFGNLGRNTFRGPGFANYNMTLVKAVKITERVNVDFRADFINLFNHRNFGNPVVTMNSPIFGQNTSDPVSRNITMSAKVRF